MHKIEDYDGGAGAVKSRVYTYENAVPTSMVDPYDLRNYLIQTGYHTFDMADLIHPKPITQTNTYYSSSRIPGVPVEDTRIYYSKVTGKPSRETIVWKCYAISTNTIPIT